MTAEERWSSSGMSCLCLIHSYFLPASAYKGKKKNIWNSSNSASTGSKEEEFGTRDQKSLRCLTVTDYLSPTVAPKRHRKRFGLFIMLCMLKTPLLTWAQHIYRLLSKWECSNKEQATGAYSKREKYIKADAYNQCSLFSEIHSNCAVMATFFYWFISLLRNVSEGLKCFTYS